ncbi:Muropeptide MFS transporter AmpG [Nitrospira sp. KM1]|uniref:AmpG family muropeptide MFS transporter n=1 Tax=Nitrospira sp. KM1 TaxID=1936990 RepID=UPI0013A7AB7B|nr:MFS transporter [Nitrospira sp. KM1]BCA53404.1 Muropeptide MFS transporter AmpG [Nitrospira sp. KM1]
MSSGRSLTRTLANTRIAIMLPLGFASGLPLALTSGTLQAWLTVAGLDLKTIGFFTLVGIPYTFKFLWAPLMDHLVPPWLGRRRGWMLVAQAGTAAGLACMGLIGPGPTPDVLGIAALTVAFLSASLDIVFDAYRTDVLAPAERGFGAAVWVNGYRFAMLVASSGALILADHIGWRNTYLVLAALMATGILTIVLAPEPPKHHMAPSSLTEAVTKPLTELFFRPGMAGILALILLYKLGDAVAASLQTAFFIGGLGFSASDVGYVKAIGIFATLIGALGGGMAMASLGLVRSLFLFGLFQALSNLCFTALAWAGKSYSLLTASVMVENLTGGMGTAAFVALVMSLCDHRYTATQFAILSSVEAMGRVFAGRPSAELVAALGWAQFFFISFLIALPGVWLVWVLRKRLAHSSAEASIPESALL